MTEESNTHRIRYQELFEFAPDCQLVTDARGVILEANHAAAALFQCSKAFLIDKPLGLFVVTGFRSRFYESLTRLMGLYGTDEFESCIGRRGETRNVAVRAIAVDERPTGLLSLRWQLHDITEQRRTEAVRTDLLHRLVTAQENERRRLARELHDEMGQHMTALILDLKLLGDTLPIESNAREQLERAQRAAGQIGHAIHRLAVELRPTALDDLGLEATIRNHLFDWSAHTNIRAEFRGLGPTAQRMPSNIETTIYRIMQETLTNAAKHARATLVSVILERKERAIRLIVEDNGLGFEPEAVFKTSVDENRLGLLGMKERVAMTNGSLIIESEPGGPTSIFVEIPIPEA